MKKMLTVFLLAAAAGGVALAEQPELPYWKVDDVHAGMKGVGKTVLRGSDVQEFQFEIIGVLKNVFPKRDLFLAKLSGMNLETTGVISGMSGSPLYSDGKFLGAVAYGWPFTKEPIAGITPAEYMMMLVPDARLPEPAEELAQAPAAGRVLPGSAAREAAAPPMAEKLPAAGGPPRSFSLARLRAPVVLSGVPQPVFEHYAERFERMGMLPVQGGGGNDANIPATLAPGSAVAIALLSGDMSIAGIGTVTERAGDEVLAFGHPMMEMGRVALPMAAARVDAVVPSSYFSFKMGSAGPAIGTLVIDRSEGVCGRVGTVPRTVPMTVTVKRNDFPSMAAYTYQLADCPELTGMLVEMALFSSVFMKGSLPREHTIRFKMRVVTHDGTPVQIEDSASSTTAGMWSFFGSVTGVVENLMRNPFKRVQIKEVSAELEISPGDDGAFIESVRLPRVKAAPGKSLRAFVSLTRYRKPTEEMEVEVPIPAATQPGTYNLLITDANGARQADANAVPSQFDPRTYDELIEALRRQYSSTDIYVILGMPGTGVAVRGKPLPNLPDSYLSMLTPVGQSKTDFVRAVLKSSKATPYHITGSQNVQIVVEKED